MGHVHVRTNGPMFGAINGYVVGNAAFGLGPDDNPVIAVPDIANFPVPIVVRHLP